VAVGSAAEEVAAVVVVEEVAVAAE